nr:hypothetical protein [Tanacetum cinerariifolium]
MVKIKVAICSYGAASCLDMTSSCKDDCAWVALMFLLVVVWDSRSLEIFAAMAAIISSSGGLSFLGGMVRKMKAPMGWLVGGCGCNGGIGDVVVRCVAEVVSTRCVDQGGGVEMERKVMIGV